MVKNETSLESEISYLQSEQPIGLLITLVAAGYEKEFLQRLTEDKMFSTISPADHSVLRCIAFDEFSSVEIARKLGVSKQAIGKTVSSLEARGFIVRKESKDDRRSHILMMTSKGKHLLAHSSRVAKELEELTVAILGRKKLKLLKELLTQIMEQPRGSIDKSDSHHMATVSGRTQPLPPKKARQGK